MSTGLLAFSILVTMAVGAFAVAVWYDRQSRRERLHREQESSKLALELHPTYQQKVAADRAYELQCRKQQADEYKFQQEFALKRYMALHYVSPETYIVNAQPTQITALPSLKQVTAGKNTRDEDGSPSSDIVIPSPFDLSEVIRHRMPSDRGVFIARGATSGDIWVEPHQLCHVLGGGLTGGGKSIIVRNIGMQLASLDNVQTYLYDPNASPIKRQPDGRVLDNRPFYPRLANGKPITDAKEMEDFLEYMVRKELEERRLRERTFRAIGNPIFIEVEELPVLADEAPNAIPHLAKLLKRSRQYLIFLVCVSQTLLVKTTGLDTGDRSQYRTGLYTGGDDITAKVVLDIKSIKEIDEKYLSGKGAVYSRTDVSPLQVSRTPYASNAACYSLLGNPSGIALPDHPVSEREWERLGALLREEQSLSPLTSDRPFVRQTGPLGESGESAVRVRVEPGETVGESLTARQSEVRVSPEERKLIVDAARAQLKDPNRTKVAIQKLINEHNPPMNQKWWDKIKQVLSEEGL